ncbi:hypothetical protein SLA2020_475780 [Shorea laevis]
MMKLMFCKGFIGHKLHDDQPFVALTATVKSMSLNAASSDSRRLSLPPNNIVNRNSQFRTLENRRESGQANLFKHLTAWTKNLNGDPTASSKRRFELFHASETNVIGREENTRGGFQLI